MRRPPNRPQPAPTEAVAEEPTEEVPAEEPTEEMVEEPPKAHRRADRGPRAHGSRVEEATGEPMKIGVMSDLTGALALFGNEMVNGLELGFDYATDGTYERRGPPRRTDHP